MTASTSSAPVAPRMTLKEFAAYKGFTRDVQLARFLDLSQGQLTEYLRGSRRPGLDVAIDIARRTGGLVPVEVWETLANMRGRRRRRSAAGKRKTHAA